MGTFNSGLFLGDVSKRSLFPESPDVEVMNSMINLSDSFK